jgi:hypothetical protein
MNAGEPLHLTGQFMSRDTDYFRRRAAEARSAAFCKESGKDVEVAGDLALAYAALARRRAASAAAVSETPAEAAEIIASD